MQKFSDFVEEALNYEYSMEHFNLCKECANISLMEMYIESQLFMANNADVINGGEMEFTEGFLFESIEGIDELNAIYEEAEAKKKNIFKRLWERIKQLIAKFGNFLMRAAGSEKLLSEEEVRKLEGKLQSLKIENSVLLGKLRDLEEKYGIAIQCLHEAGMENSTLKNKLRAANDARNDAISDSKALRSQLQKSNEENKALKDENSKLKKTSGERLGKIANLEAELKNARIKIISGNAKGERMKYAVSPDLLVNLLTEKIFSSYTVTAKNGDKLDKNHEFDPKVLKEVVSELNKAISDGQANGIKVHIAPSAWKGYGEKIQSYQSKFQAVSMDEIDADAETTAKINEYHSLISKVIASTMVLFDSVRLELHDFYIMVNSLE